MGFIVKGLGSLLGGGGGSGAAAAAAANAAQNRLATIQQQREAQSVQDQGSSANTALAALGRAPRGQRLLMSSNDGGLATTLGGSI